MISIIIPIYNQADKLFECLESILKQTYKDYEVIVINDGSTDSLKDIIYKFSAKFNNGFIFLEQDNKGAPSARNLGFRKSRGDYLFFCDADAIIYSEALKIMFNKLQENIDASYVYSSFLWGNKIFKLWPFSEEKLRNMPYIHTMSLIRKEHFPKNGWDESLKKLQDWDLWLTMLKDGHIGVWIDKVLFKIKTGGVISSWLPSFIYKFFPFLPIVKKYNKAVEIIKKKHDLN